MWLTHFWHSWSQFFIFAWDVTAGGILRTGVLICLVGSDNGLAPTRRQATIWTNDRKFTVTHIWVTRLNELTHWDQNLMAAILQRTFSLFRHILHFKFHWTLFLGVQLTISQHWFTLCLGTVQATSHYLNQCWPRCLMPWNHKLSHSNSLEYLAPAAEFWEKNTAGQNE